MITIPLEREKLRLSIEFLESRHIDSKEVFLLTSNSSSGALNGLIKKLKSRETREELTPIREKNLDSKTDTASL